MAEPAQQEDALTRIHPARNYIKFLVLLGDNGTLEGVNESLNNLGFASASQDEYMSIRTELGTPPQDFRPHDVSHAPTAQYLRKHKIFGLVHRDTVLEEIFMSIFRFPAVREKVETLILGNVSEKEAAHRLKQVGIRLTSAAYADYRHYFWGSTHMGSVDWSLYFSHDDSERTMVKKDAYQAAIHCGKDVAIYKLGIGREIDTQQALVEMGREVYMSFREVRAMPIGPAKVMMLSHLIRGMTAIDKRLKEGDTALRDTLKKFERFKLGRDDAKLPSLADLAPTGSVSNRDRAEIMKSREQ